jgi:hypothetical protein
VLNLGTFNELAIISRKTFSAYSANIGLFAVNTIFYMTLNSRNLVLLAFNFGYKKYVYDEKEQ